MFIYKDKQNIVGENLRFKLELIRCSRIIQLLKLELIRCSRIIQLLKFPFLHV